VLLLLGGGLEEPGVGRGLVREEVVQPAQTGFQSCHVRVGPVGCGEVGRDGGGFGT